MVEEPQSLLQPIGEEEIDDDFYDNIEAPQFVDLKAPDQFRAGDDRYWFCLRVGCDQKHEEEMDPEAIYKNFILRVMAARSPNIRLRKAMFKKDLSASMKCPQTVPEKPSKPRVAKLALISSMSKRIADNKLKVKPTSMQSSTPKVKGKQPSVLHKALTTPRNKKQLSNPDAFRSVRNLKARADVAPKNKTVAKALVFHSPKKSKRTKSSLELNTPVKTLCAAMKKLEITSGKKNVLGYNRQVPSDVSRKQLRGREVKSRVYDGLGTQNPKGSQSSKYLTKKKKETELLPNHDSDVSKGIENSFGETEAKESNDSVPLCFISGTDERDQQEEGPVTTHIISKPSMDENRVEERSSGNNVVPELQAPTNESPNKNKADIGEQKMNPSLCKGTEKTTEIEENKHNLASDDKENDCNMEGDDKENASASTNSRKLDINNDNIEGKFLGKHKTPRNNLKVPVAMKKPSKQSSNKAVTGAEGIKHRKPKPTNPKPFRLRTDERRILKEANVEKKPDVLPLKEVASATKITGEKLQKRDNAIQSNEKCLERTEYSGCPDEVALKEMNRAQMDETQNGDFSRKISKERTRQNLSKTPQRHTVSSLKKLATPMQKCNQDVTAQKLGNRLKRTNPSVRKLATIQRDPSNIKEMASVTTPDQLITTQETSTTKVSSTEAPNPVTKATASPAPRLTLHEKRSTTIPKEPSFHTTHMPRSCTKRGLDHLLHN